jgi:hypothetical protein
MFDQQYVDIIMRMRIDRNNSGPIVRQDLGKRMVSVRLAIIRIGTYPEFGPPLACGVNTANDRVESSVTA